MKLLYTVCQQPEHVVTAMRTVLGKEISITELVRPRDNYKCHCGKLAHYVIRAAGESK